MHFTRQARRMLATLTLAGTGFAALSPLPAAAQVSYTFTLGGFSNGATLSGSFTGTPETGGIISQGRGYGSYTTGNNDLSAFTATFSGDGTIPSATIGLSDLSEFYYNPTGFFTGVPELTFDGSTFHAGDSSGVDLNPTSGIIEGQSVVSALDGAGNVSNQNYSFQTATITPAVAAVPEPSTLAPFALAGAALLALALRAKRRKA